MAFILIGFKSRCFTDSEKKEIETHIVEVVEECLEITPEMKFLCPTQSYAGDLKIEEVKQGFQIGVKVVTAKMLTGSLGRERVASVLKQEIGEKIKKLNLLRKIKVGVSVDLVIEAANGIF